MSHAQLLKKTKTLMKNYLATRSTPYLFDRHPKPKPNIVTQ